MSRYRKIDVRIWNDEKFRGLSDDGKLIFILVLTHPNMTAIGAMRGTLPGLAAEMGWLPDRLSEAFREALSKGIVEHDEKASCIALPNFLRYNPPESPNVVKAWEASLDLVPECTLKRVTIQRAKDFLKGKTKAFAEALPKAFAEALPKPMPYQEQEPEQDQEPKQVGRDDEGYPLRAHTREGHDIPFDLPQDGDGWKWLEEHGVHPSRIDEAHPWLMGQRLYADRLETFKQPARANSYAEAKGRAA